MKVSFVSSQAISQAMRYQTQRLQSDLMVAQKELTSWRYADVGLALGARTGVSVSHHREIERLSGLIDSNQLASSRLKATQLSLQDLTRGAEDLLADYTTASSGSSAPRIARQQAESILSMASSVLNANLNGEHIFAGINTDMKPIADFMDPNSLNRQALDTAFQSFPFADRNDITEAEMTAFITSIEDQFLGNDWHNLWSSATDQQITSRITLTETAQTSVSANMAGIRKLVMAAAIVVVGFEDTMSKEGREVLINRGIELLGQSVADLANQQGYTGITEQRIERANERMSMQTDLFKKSLIDLEGVDEYEASTRVTGLLAQIELSYSLTARLQQMSLLKFLS